MTSSCALVATIVCSYLLESTTQMVSTSFSLRATFIAPSKSQLPPPCPREDSQWCATVEHLQERREHNSQKMVLPIFKTVTVALYSRTECKIPAKCFTVSPEPRVSIPDFVSQLWRKSNFSRELQDKIWNGTPECEAISQSPNHLFLSVEKCRHSGLVGCTSDPNCIR